MTCGIVAVGSEVERAVGGEGRIEVVAVFGVDGCGKNRRIGPYARRCVALGDPDAEARHFALRRWADRCEVELGAVGVEMRRDVERGSGKRQRLGWPPMAVLEVADAEHRKTWRSGVWGDEREVEVGAVWAEDTTGFVEVGGDKTGRKECRLRDEREVEVGAVWAEDTTGFVEVGG